MPAEIRLIDWRPVRKGQLYGFATIEFQTLGLRIFEIPVLRGRDGPWACVPTRAQIGQGGHQRRDVDGRPLYDRVLGWRTRQLETRFATVIVDLVRRAHPGDIGG